MMTQDEYDFLTGQWKGPKMAAYNAVFGFCRSFGWMTGFDLQGRPVLTNKGIQAVKHYQIEQNNRKGDAI